MSAKTKVIQDPVHGYLIINENEQRIIDTGIFQRLKRIRHLPAESVYPSATHTRFEHSLGVASLGVFVFDALLEKGNLDLKVMEDKIKFRNTVKYACLLHDVGQTPLSHVCEKFGDDAGMLYDKFIEKHNLNLGPRPTGPSHEWTSCAISLEYFCEDLENLGIDIELFCRMICGRVYEDDEKPWLNPLIAVLNSWMDVDKIDYILRDSRMSGAVLANVDKNRIISSFDVENNELVISKSGFSVVSQLIYGREALYLWLYTHHAVAYYQDLIKRYISKLRLAGVKDVQDLFTIGGLIKGADDNDLHHILRREKKRDSYTEFLYSQIYDRKFYKALWKTPFEANQLLGSLVMNKLLGNLERLEHDILNDEDLNLPPNSVFAYEASFVPFEAEAKVWVAIGEKYFKFGELFTESIYKVGHMITKTPYLRVAPDVYNRRDEIMDYLKKWSPI